MILEIIQFRSVKESFGIQVLVAEKFVTAAVDIVGSGFCHDVYDRPRVPAVFRVERVSQHAEFGNGIRNAQRQVAATVLNARAAAVSMDFVDTDRTPYDTGTFASVASSYSISAVRWRAPLPNRSQPSAMR